MKHKSTVPVVVEVMVGLVGMVEGVPVTLCLHVVVFNLKLLFVLRGNAGVLIVLHCVPIVVQREILDSMMVTLIEANVLWIADVVMLFIVRGC